MDVAQESYFYKMYALSPVEILACWNFAKQFPPFMWSIAESLLKGYEAISYNMMSETDKRDFSLHIYSPVLLTPYIIAPKASFYNPITYTKSKFLKLPNLHQKQASLNHLHCRIG